MPPAVYPLLQQLWRGQGPTDLDEDRLTEGAEEFIRMQIIAVCFTGGEPLMLGDAFFRLAERLRSDGIMVSMVTNRRLITEDIGKKIT